MNTRRQLLLAALVLLPALSLMALLLPRGALDTDLERIGRGTPALVLVFENHQPLSMNTIALLKPLQRQYGERLLLLAADIGTPAGNGLMQRHGAHGGEVLSFAEDGRLLARGPIGDAEQLRRRLKTDFGLVDGD